MARPIVLCIMDGYGICQNKCGNAILAAKKPNLDYLFSHYPNILLEASGSEVGLPKKQMGNSEVGHLNIGAGRIVYQSLTLLNNAIESKEFFKNAAFNNAIENCKKNNSNLHIMGLFSDGGVHSHIDHIFALLDLAKENGIKNIYVHAILDGRDVEPKISLKYLKTLDEKYKGSLASISGRYYAMDRDKNFDRVEKYYEVIVEHKGECFTNYEEAINADYNKQGNNASDEFVTPKYYKDSETIKDNDSVIFANFRPDRAIEIATLITNPSYYDVYKPNKKLKDIFFVSMMKYADSVKGEIAFKLQDLNNVLGVYLANKNYKQLRIAETEKYAHVTFFLDGQVKYDGIENEELKGCKRILIPSPKVATYDLKPSMSAYEVCTALINELDKKYLDVVIVNFANCDMVGHTAVEDAVIKAVEVVDDCVGKIYQKVNELGGVMMITADHGNADCIKDEFNNPVTSHTTRPVPLIITSNEVKFIKEKGKLGDLAPTLLYLLGEEIPNEMSGEVLIKGGN